ncbi:MAG: EAL domain-containing protein [Pseudomonadota bacterium]
MTARLALRFRAFLAAALLVIGAAAVATAPVTARFLERVDLMIYDLFLPLQAPLMSPQITVVAIDDRSINTLGRWPWSRRYQAQLLDRLTGLGARVIGLDVLFSEWDSRENGADRALIETIAESTVVLPVAPVRLRDSAFIEELMPLPDLALAASGLGHVDVELDRDGLSRSTFLFGGVGGARWPSMALAMLAAAGEGSAQAPAAEELADPGSWIRAERRLIPFAASGDGPAVVSYSDVLENRVAPELIRDRFVLVGATASGLGDALSTPGAPAHERMPGVVLNAHILNGLLQGRMIHTIALRDTMALKLGLVVAVVLAILVLPQRADSWVAIIGITVTLALAAAMLGKLRVWFPPATCVLAIALAWLASLGWNAHRTRQLNSRLLGELEHQSNYQRATGLPNQGMLVDQLRQLPDSASATRISSLMLVHINWQGSASILLDRLLPEPMLKSISDRIRAVAPDGAYVAHLSSDDFAVLTHDFPDVNAANQAAGEFLKSMQVPLAHKDDHLLLGPEIGVSLWPDAESKPEHLLRNAYTAMFKSRVDDAEQLFVYTGSASEKLQTRSMLEQALVFALERREFTIYYQPQVAANDGRILGAEVLLRWNNPELGWVSPGSFVPVAEHVGLIRSIGTWVMENACYQLADWDALGFQQLRLAINVSPLQFLSPGLEDDVADIVARTGIAPKRIELEITESSLMHDIGSAVRVMERIRKLGIEIAIDDFGTGYSSLSNLSRFPLDRLKVDQAFTSEIGTSGYADQIAQTIVAMGQHLGLEVIAEGVETEAQAQFLRDRGCDCLQGYLFGKPMSAEDFTALLEKEFHT